MSGLIGQTLGRYQILELLGEGGMATVYKAYDTRLEREVAIKVIRREAFPPDEMEMLLKRFEREAKLLGRLSHPNIVGVIDYGEFEGLPYLVMVYLPGGTLKDRLGKPMPWRDAVQLILPIAHALDYVHDHNIINRDVKPSNILMTEKGQPMLTDFGLVKLFGDKDKVKEAVTLTSSGTGLGTPDYMAPEQWTGETTAQSDLYSLGVVLYEMITGHKPYTADTPAGVLLKQATESLPLPKQYIPNLPQNVESVLLKVLAKKPGDRYPNVHAFADELQNLLAGREVSATAIKPEQLREQMTGKVDKRLIEQSRNIASLSTPPPARQKKAFPTLIAVLGTLGILVLLLAVGALWFKNTNPGMVVPATATQQVLPSPTATNIPPTETIRPTDTPTEVPLPTETPVPLEIRDNKNIPMRFVPAGEFTMGSNDGDIASRPANVVNLGAFYIDKFEVTNEMYDACVYAVKCRRQHETGSSTRTNNYYKNPVFDNYPVIYVDWKMAKTYCEWRGARLPTEAEWEKAARGTDERAYPWGDDKPDCSLANFYGCVGDTTPVDQHEKGQSIYGVYGMAGNVGEWTSSLFKLYPYNATDGRENLDASGERAARGGSWHEFGGNSGNVRTDTRLKLDPGYYGAYVGFRCALTSTSP
jgi:serine/threonine protein kinase